MTLPNLGNGKSLLPALESEDSFSDIFEFSSGFVVDFIFVFFGFKFLSKRFVPFQRKTKTGIS